MKSKKGFIGMGTMLAIIVGLGLIGGGTYYATQHRTNTTPNNASETTTTTDAPVKQAQVQPQVKTPTPTTPSATVTTKSSHSTSVSPTPKTAHLIYMNDRIITLDYIDVYNGTDAVKMMVADGKCSSIEQPDCIRGVPIYDRNTSAKLRTFTFAPDVVFVSDRGTTMSMSEFQKFYGTGVPAGAPYGNVFDVTLNGANQVTKVQLEFRS